MEKGRERVEGVHESQRKLNLFLSPKYSRNQLDIAARDFQELLAAIANDEKGYDQQVNIKRDCGIDIPSPYGP